MLELENPHGAKEGRKFKENATVLLYKTTCMFHISRII
jgi:hypothetical protein